MSNTWYCQPLRKLEGYSLQHCQPLNSPQLWSYSNIANGNGCSILLSQDRFCTLESSTLTANHSASTVSLSPNESSLSHQDYPAGGLQIKEEEDVSELKHKLKELETVMFGPDVDFLETYDDSVATRLASAEIDSWRQLMEVIPRGDLKQLLTACAKAVSNCDWLMAQWLMSELRQLVSVSGAPVQRLGAYMLEGLVALMSTSGSSINKSLKLREPASFELLSYMHMLYEIGQGSQWIPLIQAFAARPGGPPHIRITGVDDITSAYARGGGLNMVGRRLAKLAQAFKVPFTFHAVAVPACEVRAENLGIRAGEALAVNFAFMLHRMADESVSTENHRDRLLRMVKGLNPKVVTLVEHELNTNTAAFYPRFVEALDYYTAMFESIDVTLKREHKERINVEQHCLARDVVNIIACEGAERVERHEPHGKWRSRFTMAGFSPNPLSSLVNATIKTLLQNYCDRYSLSERDGALFLGWLNRDLVAASAWK
ncbi:scarecrow-like protein 21 isoform X2 [Salvia hispanica]|uniref:scarecrow-like protein 21 isoform X2 n=1 Tax=Salvia hispanica TaxID=49212 RepID=UPI00200971B5|nr:scarecrow-like protein 21 isoform X2 [Salvia hispanica]